MDWWTQVLVWFFAHWLVGLFIFVGVNSKGGRMPFSATFVWFPLFVVMLVLIPIELYVTRKANRRNGHPFVKLSPLLRERTQLHLW